MDGHVLITGGCGFVGSNLIPMLLRRWPGCTITNVDALTYAASSRNVESALADEPALLERYELVEGDVCDAGLMRDQATRAELVIHLAAESHVDRSIDEPAPFIRTNVLGTQTLLDAVRGCDAPPPLVHISTDEVFGDLPVDQPDLRFDEQSPLRPSSPYSASKAGADMLVLAAGHTYGLDVRIVTGSNLMGPWQHVEKLVPAFTTRLLRGEQVPLYGDGSNVRDWLHVMDFCEAIALVAERGRSGERYCAGASNERSNLELTRELLAYLKLGEDRIERVADRLGHDRRYALDATKLRAELGWEPARSNWPGMLHETVEWYRQQGAGAE